MIEAVPCEDNEERLEYGGAFIACWVKAETEEAALTKAWAYVAEEKWKLISVEEKCAAHREAYLDDPESLECFDAAVRDGLAAIFYTWPPGEA